MKNKEFNLGKVLIVIGLSIITFFEISTLVHHRKVINSGEEYVDRTEFSFTEDFAGENDTVNQYFVPQHAYLESISLRLAVNYEGLDTDGWELEIRLLDKNDCVIKQNTITTDDFENWRYYTFEVDQRVRRGEEYRLTIRQTAHSSSEGEWPISIVCFIAPEELKESVKCTYNGKLIEGNIEVVYHYSCFDWISAILVLAADTLILFILYRKWKAIYAIEQRQTLVNGMLWVISPIFLYLVTELVTGYIFDIPLTLAARNIAVSYVLLLFFTLCFRKFKTGAILYSVSLTIVALVIHYVWEFRGRSFMLYDFMNFRTALTVSRSYVYEVPLILGLGLRGLLTYIAVQRRLQKGEWPSFLRMRVIRFSMFCTVLAVMICAIRPLESSATTAVEESGTHEENDSVENMIENNDGNIIYVIEGVSGEEDSFESFNFWDVESNYKDKGFLYSLLLQSRYLSAEKPEGYSADRVNEVINNTNLSDSEDCIVYEEKTIPTNIIVIMNESFADLEGIGQIATKTELLPFFHNLEENTVRGWLHVPVFGAGTAESEYEVLTGNTKQFLPVGSTAYQLYCKTPEFGLSSYYKQMGYHTVAIHPYYGENWNRTEVYPQMEFDEFISIENWEGAIDMIRWCASDYTAYDKVIDIVNQKENNECLFVFLVTMQNHGGYGIEAANGFEPTVVLNYDTEYPEAEMYLSLLNESDHAFELLIHHFEDVDEPTMIVMFGDHLPSIEEAFYEELFGGESGTLSIEQVQMRYRTPFVIWTNYPQNSIEEECMSANYLGSRILELTGMKLPGYNQFLLELKKSIPIIGIGAVCDSDGQWYSMNEIPPEYEQKLNDYKVLQYNRIFDRKNTVTNFFNVQ